MFRLKDPHELEMMFQDAYPRVDVDVPQDLQDCADDLEGCGIDPREYNWQEEDTETVRHVAEDLFSQVP